ncbi:hypothetical protein [Catenulispora rubra]|uniref:hypothetical protein n=1 Tax=Catenulispora rubra TaxID=280293 RepID=UPI00189259EC|nr:hypothetical protein [Catenulispora rubra]
MARELAGLLRTLQHEVRSKGDPSSPHGRGGKIPTHLATAEASWLQVDRDAAQLIDQLVAALLDDEHFEYLAGKADATVWEFTCKCALDRRTDHVKTFMRDHRRDLESFTVQFSVDHLTVASPELVGDVVLLPLPDASTREGQHLRHDSAAGCMAQLEVTGTNSIRAIERGRERARHALSLLRLSLADMNALNQKQLRFRLGEMYLTEGYEGFSRHSDVAYGMDFPKPIIEVFPTFRPLDIPFNNGTEIETRIGLALSWIDAAYMDASPIHRIGFLFTALEAILGDSSEGLKAPALVFYRTALGHIVRGHFPDPNRLYYLYDRVRSYATHGEPTPDVSEDDVSYLNWNIRETLLDLVSFSRERNLTSRKKVRQELLRDGVDQLTLDFLRSHGPQEWWGEWSPGPPQRKSQREQELAAKVESLETELDMLKEQRTPQQQSSTTIQEPGA